MDLGPSEALLILLVVVLLFGAKRLPELAKSAGRALRIFREETRTLGSDSPSDCTSSPDGAAGPQSRR